MRACVLTARAVALALPLGLSQPLWAADLPARPITKAPAAIVAASWTGFYVNAGGGYGLWAADTKTTGLPGFGEPTLPANQIQGGKGWVARLGGGYDHQFNARIVAGVFADYDFSDIKGSIRDGVVNLSADIKQTSSWTVGARIGWLVTPEILTYTTAGFSYARFSQGLMAPYADFTGSNLPAGRPTGYVTQPFNKKGWFLGGGVETVLGSGWFWRNEYRYARYSNELVRNINVFSTNATLRFNDINVEPSVQTVTTQVVYKFNSGVKPVFASAARANAPVKWTGAHVEGGLGYGLWAANLTTSPVPESLGEAFITVPQRQGGKGWLGRVGGGYDYQLTSRIVGGVFADFDFSNLKGTIADPGSTVAGDIKQQWAVAAGGRAGLIVTPDILGYVSGGYTATHFSSSTMSDVSGTLFFAPAVGVTSAFTQGGWFVGLGTEYALTSLANGLFVRTEYRYANYGNRVVPVTVVGTPPVTPATQLNNINFSPVVQTVTTELVYKFDGPY